MTRLTRPDSELTLEALAERIEALELRPSMGAVSQPAFETVPASVAASAVESESVVSRVAEEPPASTPVDDTPPWEDAAPVAEPMSTPEPEPAPAAEPIAAVATADMSPERLLAALLSVVKREDAATGALLSGVSLSTEDGQYQLLFPTGSDFQMRVVNGPEAKAIINKAFAEVLGHEVHFSCQIGSFSGLSAQPAPLTSEPPMSIADDIPPIDDGYFESLVAEQSAVPADEMPADFADALSAFGAGVKVHEINDEE